MREGRQLGAFLTARRKVTLREHAGLQTSGRRQTSGLSREEVARLAGISHDYYVRIEQGRVPHPSSRVLDALAQVLRLDSEATRYLHRLANPCTDEPPAVDPPEARASRLVDRLHWPAIALNRRMDVLARNHLATLLHGGLQHGDNLMRMLFLNPVAHEGILEWDQEAALHVAHLRATTGVSGHSFAAELVEELSSESRRFHELWRRHDVRLFKPAPLRLRYRGLGDLTLERETLLVADADMFIFTLEPEIGTPSERALSLMASGWI
ncbi:helix-turn-helix transcriptional regulator [Planotetraspora kaengkrachanensis]|uniref:Transcriptional regulator n=1 Tax=Planotetraspora kaengkrachanensis TaxID=575193 RepID=A0A8J3PU88_9ACTN|nr:helix-turn-helix transcriptional regulator [Planotetraspora kaengkrachanensis]GIG81166.1 transcriptional regulator [Planotetraspora kaengkrachanensis]